MNVQFVNERLFPEFEAVAVTSPMLKYPCSRRYWVVGNRRTPVTALKWMVSVAEPKRW